MIILRAKLRPNPDTGERRKVRTEGPDFAAARATIDEQTPDGWIRMYLITGDEAVDDASAAATS